MNKKKKYQMITGILLIVALCLLARQIYYYFSLGLCLRGGLPMSKVEEDQIFEMHKEMLFRCADLYSHFRGITSVFTSLSLGCYFFLSEDNLKGNKKIFWRGLGIIFLIQILFTLYILRVQLYPEFFRYLRQFPVYIWLFVVASTLKPLEE